MSGLRVMHILRRRYDCSEVMRTGRIIGSRSAAAGDSVRSRHRRNPGRLS
jgi:hypothetical protein